MKKIFPLISFIFLIVLFTACGKKDSGSDSGATTDRPIIKVTKSSITADGFDETTISVVDKNGNDVTTQCWVTGNNIQITNFTYSTITAGSITVKAKLVGVESLPITINATAPTTNRHTKKVIAEDYTGAWCGYCPRVGKALEDLSGINPNIIPIAVHNADVFAYSLEAQMRSRWGVTGFPTAVINRNFKWNENSSTIYSEAAKWAPLGLAIESNIGASTITGKIKSQFNVTTTLPLTVTIMLLENGKIAAQRNYMNAESGPFFGLGDPIVNYVHNHILRVSSTSIFGDVIPSSATVKDNIYELPFTFNTSGYDVTKCDIVAVVSFADGIPNKMGVLNAQIVKAGQTKAFD